MRTLLMIKPNCMKKNKIGEILAIIESAGFEIEDIKMFTFNERLIADFYAEHVGKDFFGCLQNFMCSAKTIAVILNKGNAVEDLRTLVGNTNPAKADKGTIRALFGDSLTENGVHASDSPESAEREIKVLFS